jgi:hypothetical protein
MKRNRIKIEVPESIEIINGTTYKTLDAIVKALAYKVFKFNEIKLHIHYLPKHINSGEVWYFGMVEKAFDTEHSYIILLSKYLGFRSLKRILSHEFVHIGQHERYDLIINGTDFIWKGEEGSFKEIPYKNRGFEIEALERQATVLKDLNKILRVARKSLTSDD